MRTSAANCPELTYLTMGDRPRSANGSSFDPAGTEPDTTAMTTATNPTRPRVAKTAVSAANDDDADLYKDWLFRFFSPEWFYDFM